MFDYTKEAINVLVCDYKKALKLYKIFAVVGKVAPFVYFIYALFVGVANAIVNIVFCVISMFFIVREAILAKKIKNIRDILPDLKKQEKREAKKELKFLRQERQEMLATNNWIKLLDATFDLIFIGYTIFATSTHLTWVSVLLAVFVVISWLLRIAVLLVATYINNRKRLLTEAVKEDITNPFNAVDTVKRFFGKEKEENRVIKFLDERMEKRK